MATTRRAVAGGGSVRALGRGGGAPTASAVGTGRSAFRARLAALEERVETIVHGLGGRYTIELAMPNTLRAPPRLVRGGYSKAQQGTVAEIFGYFVHGTKKMVARNVLQLTPGASQAIIDEVVQKYVQREGEIPTLSQLMPGIAYAWRALVVRRIEKGGGDLNLHKLDPDYRTRKLALGYPATIGQLTGQTLEAVRRAQPIIRKAA